MRPPTLSYPEVMTIARSLAPAVGLPKHLRGSEADLFLVLQAGQELGLAPVASINSFHLIDGAYCLSAHAMIAVVLGSGLCEYFDPVEQTEERATWETQRRGRPVKRRTYTLQQLQESQASDIAIDHPARTISARCKSYLARDVYPDVLAGFIGLEEVPSPAQPSRAAAIAAVAAGAVGEIYAFRDAIKGSTYDGKTAAEAATAPPMAEDGSVAVTAAPFVPGGRAVAALGLLREIELASSDQQLDEIARIIETSPLVVRDAVMESYRRKRAAIRGDQ